MKELIQKHLFQTYDQYHSSSHTNQLNEFRLFVQAIWFTKNSLVDSSNQKLYQKIMSSLNHLLTFLTLLSQLSQVKSYHIVPGISSISIDIPESILQLLLLNSLTLFVNNLLQISDTQLIINIMKLQTKYIDIFMNSTDLSHICEFNR